jgi:hypothetical protein
MNSLLIDDSTMKKLKLKPAARYRERFYATISKKIPRQPFIVY